MDKMFNYIVQLKGESEPLDLPHGGSLHSALATLPGLKGAALYDCEKFRSLQVYHLQRQAVNLSLGSQYAVQHGMDGASGFQRDIESSIRRLMQVAHPEIDVANYHTSVFDGQFPVTRLLALKEAMEKDPDPFPEAWLDELNDLSALRNATAMKLKMNDPTLGRPELAFASAEQVLIECNPGYDWTKSVRDPIVRCQSGAALDIGSLRGAEHLGQFLHGNFGWSQKEAHDFFTEYMPKSSFDFDALSVLKLPEEPSTRRAIPSLTHESSAALAEFIANTLSGPNALSGTWTMAASVNVRDFVSRSACKDLDLSVMTPVLKCQHPGNGEFRLQPLELKEPMTFSNLMDVRCPADNMHTSLCLSQLQALLVDSKLTTGRPLPIHALQSPGGAETMSKMLSVMDVIENRGHNALALRDALNDLRRFESPVMHPKVDTADFCLEHLIGLVSRRACWLESSMPVHEHELLQNQLHSSYFVRNWGRILEDAQPEQCYTR
ncbi:hypothetical protein AB6D11_00305 [Vibrio splendidus]